MPHDHVPVFSGVVCFDVRRRDDADSTGIAFATAATRGSIRCDGHEG